MWMPPPTSSSGRSALAMIAAARSSSCGSGRVRRACAFSVRVIDPEIGGIEIVLAVADILRHVEHDRPRPSAEVATAKARRTSSGIRLVPSTRISSFTAGLRISICRASCVMFFQA